MSNNNEAPEKPVFVALTPVDDEQIYNNYKDALNFALSEKEIHNIGLTGPYGSGKSSVIKSYESRAKNYKFLNISLASFTDINQSNNDLIGVESKKETSKQPDVDVKEIEKGILQQIIFSVPQATLPFSRLNRIKEPDQPNLITGLLFGWLFLAVFLYHEKEYFITFEFLNSKLWFIAIWYLVFGYLLSIPLFLFKNLYVSLHKISLKEISYGKAKIVSDDFKSESIFNQFLDEIIYFFMVSEINVVVFEDIDRFNKPEIFVKLREINKIVNDHLKNSNKHVKSIKFIYLLKDSIFNEDDKRTKFFDFIIPIIPVINDFNSYEKIKQKLNTVELNEVKENFLEDISFYIYDLRLINNIFNEFKVLKKQLKADNLDKTKLLAIVVYKNIYPSDFEKLHHRNGALYKILNIKDELININKDFINTQIAELTGAVKSLDREVANNINELTNIYLGYIIRNCGVRNAIGLILNGVLVPYSAIQDHHLIELSKNKSQVTIYDSNSNQHSWKSMSNVESEINGQLSFIDRMTAVENIKKRQKHLDSLSSLNNQISSIEKRKISELLRENVSHIDAIFKEEKIANGDLLQFLLMSNHIDEDYYLYISIFHEGSWSSNDREFLISVKSYKKYDPDYKVDNPSEVLLRLRNDYSSKQLLNINIFDYILNSPSRYTAAFNGIERYLLDHEQELKIFIDKYLEQGNKVDAFICWISKSWTNFNDCFIESTNVPKLIKNTVLYVDLSYLNENSKEKVRELVNVKTDEILTSEFKSHDFEKMVLLEVKIQNISLIKGNDDLVEFILTKNLYEINVENIRFIMQKIPEEAIETRNYTTITHNFSSIKNYIHSNIQDYVNNVFLELPRNDNEDEASTIELLSMTNDHELQKKIISKQNFKVIDIAQIDKDLHEYVLSTNKVYPNWKNFNAMVNSIDRDKLIQFLIINYELLSKNEISEDGIHTSEFIYESTIIEDDIYDKLVNHTTYMLDSFPKDCSKSKKEILIKNGCMQLTNETYASVEDDNNLLALLIINDIDNFSVALNSISEPVCKLILESEKLDRDQKLNVCYLLAHAKLPDVKIKITIAEFILEGDFDNEKIPNHFLHEIIQISQHTNTSVKLITYLMDIKNTDWILDAISKLVSPYNKISESDGGEVVLPKNRINIKFSNKLKKMELVSSVTIQDDIEIQKFRR